MAPTSPIRLCLLDRSRTQGQMFKVQHYEGERGAERMVRVESANGNVQYYEGEQGAERCVRAEFANGMVQHYEDSGSELRECFF